MVFMIKVTSHKLLNFKQIRNISYLVVLSFLSACTQNFNKNSENQNLLFASSSPLIATGFEIKDSANIKVIDCWFPWNPSQKSLRFVLSKIPVDPKAYDANANIIIPLKSIVCMSATHVSFLDALNVTDKITGIGSAGFVASEYLQERIKTGEVEDIAAGDQFRLEKLIALKPDVVFVSAQRGSNHDAIINAGIPVIPVGEYLENHPLGRAEWIKFFGEFFEKAAEAEAIFDSIKSEYNRLQTLTVNITKRPTVLSGKQYGGFWNLPGGRSYFARFLHDAGATYIWSESKETTGLSLDFETVFLRGINADFWRFLVYSNQPYSYDMLLAEDNRYENFKAFQNRSVIVCNTFSKPYHQKGVMEPQIILADLINVFHPELLPYHENVYYELLK